MIDSPLPPPVVLENLRARGREWRESSVPEDLRKFKVQTLTVEIEGSQFRMRWFGGPNPFYNPWCFGTVQPYGEGSRIRAGFKLSAREFLVIGAIVALAVLRLLGRRSIVNWMLFGAMVMLAIFTWARNRSAEPMRARLIEVLANTARQPAPNSSPQSMTMSTNLL